FGDIDDYIADINLKAEYLIDNEELVICFDDLDRKSDKLSLTDFYGYINFMVENYGTKIIIISNDKEIPEKEAKNIGKLKEKVVGVNIQFKPEYDFIFNSILEGIFKN